MYLPIFPQFSIFTQMPNTSGYVKDNDIAQLLETWWAVSSYGQIPNAWAVPWEEVSCRNDVMAESRGA